MVIVLPQNYTIQTPTPILNAKQWRALRKTYAFEPDMLITFDIRPEDDIEDNIDISFDVQTPSVLPLCEFFSNIFLSLILLISKITDN